MRLHWSKKLLRLVNVCKVNGFRWSLWPVNLVQLIVLSAGRSTAASPSCKTNGSIWQSDTHVCLLIRMARLDLSICILATALYVIGLGVTFTLVQKHVPEPYMDEIFHIPQARRYCAGNFSEVSVLDQRWMWCGQSVCCWLLVVDRIVNIDLSFSGMRKLPHRQDCT